MSEHITLVDLGSNAVRLLTARIKPGHSFEILSQQRVSTRLGSGDPGLLKPSAVRKTLKAVDSFLSGIRCKETRIIGVATAAVRDATNKMSLLEPLRRDAGISVHILSGEEEAYLGARPVLHRWPEWSGLILDLGGGSLQLTRVHAGRILSAVSLPLGVVRTTDRFLRHDPPHPDEIVSLRQEIAAQLADKVDVLTPAQGQEELIGLGGTVRTLCRMNKANKVHDDKGNRDNKRDQKEITIAFANHRSKKRSASILRRRKQTSCQNKFFPLQRSVIPTFLKQLGKIPAEERCYPGLKAERADIIVAGMVTVEEIMLHSSFSSLTVLPQGGVRHGILMRETFDTPGIPDRGAALYQPRAVLAGV